MLFDSIENYIDELSKNLDTTQQFLKKLQGGRTRLNNSIVKAQASVKLANNEKAYATSVKDAIKKSGIQAAKDILYGNALGAIRENYEFDTPAYRKGLFQAIQDDDTYLFRSRGTGLSSIMYLDINLDRTAGRLNIWGSAVKAARRELGVKVSRKDKNAKAREGEALQASRAWAGIFSKRAGTQSKFNKTIRLRLSYSGKPAPFWQLLDKGELSLPSDRGGYPTPKKKPTNFVSESENAANEYISNLLAKEKEKYDLLSSGYQTALDEAKASLAELDNLVSEIRLDFNQLQSLGRKADKILKANYITKLEKAVQLIREGLVSSKGLQTAVKGSYRGKRFDINTIKDLL